ncbi:nucleoside 2-deoxyribosyltransferase [Priestia taiwanensis]|uniref:Nucleoside deoxyribosyltransferase n=1 Tax=Priestia taiwanensis TaxID=1347902 RepID=A0A917AT81_9BACI|nr:nucleoside 2-deoxyribosyltransferase [Priestia taiwanensis]MBM7363197.1 nucleoside 2-deoxyribosyltransferase [Priestia taiwanensis]GGE68450.1 nucleoside deoxyribosyltransferase [Priestia taiwanensis]
MNKRNVYLASPFFNDKEIVFIEQVEHILESNPTFNVFSPRKLETPDFTPQTPEWAQHIFEADITHLDTADIVVAIIQDNYDDTGTSFEIGYAFATKKPVILVYNSANTQNLMLTQSCHAVVDGVEGLKAYDFDTMPRSTYSGKYF